jgi:N-acetylmuramoyl-L-alanine amidase
VRLKSLLFILSLVTVIVAQANNFVLKTIVIDAGHGGKDPGAIGPGKVQEKDVALVVALKLGDYIQKAHPDVKVIYTRKSDVFLELHERAEIANKNKADLFIAIHCNASTNPDVAGSSSYVLGLHRTEANLEVAKRENAVINLEEDKDKNYEFDPNSPEGHIIMSMKQNAFLDQSIEFASKAENQLENYAKRKSMGVKQAGFYVLYKTAMPSILAEIGFISNPDEEKFLNSVKGQDLIASALYNSFKDYKKELEGSEGEQFAYEQAVEKQKETATTPVKPATEDKPVEQVKEVVKPAATTPQAVPTNAVKVSGGAIIRKPIENANGGGKAEGLPASLASKVEDVKPIYVRPSNLDPFDTSSMGKPNKPIAEVKTEKPSTPKAETESKPVKSSPEVVAVPKSSLVPDHVTESGIVLKVQLFALKGELKDYDKISKLFGNELSGEQLPNGFTRYYGGKVKTMAEAQKLLEKAKAAGYNAAFIAGFKDGTRLSTDQVSALQ